MASPILLAIPPPLLIELSSIDVFRFLYTFKGVLSSFKTFSFLVESSIVELISINAVMLPWLFAEGFLTGDSITNAELPTNG